MIMMAETNESLKSSIQNAELIIPDGIGIVMGLKANGTDITRIPGIEFSESLISFCAQHNYTVGFLGAKESVLNEAIEKIQTKYPELQIVFCNDGYFKENEENLICKKIQNTEPTVLFVGLGVPKQELWISKYKNLFARTIMIGVGGSFDVWANKVKRAPNAFRNNGLEWLFRLLSQPSRIKRLFPTLPLFLIRVILKSKRKE